MNKQSMGELILACQDSMYRVAKTLLRSDADCADAIGEAIVKAFSRMDTLKNDRYAKSWLTRIVINECYTVLRKQSRLVSLEEYAPEDRAGDGREYSELYDAVSALPEQMRLCVALYYLEGYSVKETAQLTETTENTVKKRLARARQLLKDSLSPEGCMDEY